MNVLVTAGPVHSFLDMNKVISNRSRGIWAEKFADDLAEMGHSVTLVVSDLSPPPRVKKVQRVLKHSGYSSYFDLCTSLAETHQAAVLAAAVTNYIPKNPYPGKMPTNEDEIDVRFVKAPSVINLMRKINPKLFLVGCKLTVGETVEETVSKAQSVIDASGAHLVVANDLDRLSQKLLCFPDGSVHIFDIKSAAPCMYEMIAKSMSDDFFHTTILPERKVLSSTLRTMQDLLDRFSGEFCGVFAGKEKAFGSIAVRDENDAIPCTPRRKKASLSAADCILVSSVNCEQKEIMAHGGKATMNAPLLYNVLQKYPSALAVVHLHDSNKRLCGPIVPYAPPGTIRDSLRPVPGASFVIEKHGSVFCI